jgi:hypothetical protein
VLAVVPGDTRLEFETRDVIHQLSEYRAARLHAALCDQPVERPTTAQQARSQKISKSAATPCMWFTINALR